MAEMQTAFSLQRRRSGVNYPSPFFDIASTYVPPSVKEMFKWCRFYYYSHSVVSPIIQKMSEYPITGLIYQYTMNEDEGEDTALPMKSKEIWKKLMESTLHIKSKLIELLLDYNTYGNAFISVLYPFKRYLTCPSCQNKIPIEKASYKWKDLKFKGVCAECGTQVDYEVDDVQIKNRSMCRLIRWNPFNMDIDHTGPTDERTYVYKIPSKDKKSIIAGKRAWIERAPYVFIEAVRRNHDIELDPKNLFHFKRPGIADNDMGWGMPMILPIIKDAYWLQIIRKGNEAISLDHISPWRIISPAANAEVSPYVNQNLGSWKNKVEKEIQKWRQDPNHISVFPLPINAQNFGGDARLLMVKELEHQVQQQIAGGLGVPLELVFGGLSWSGSSVSLRILENHFLTDRELIDEFLNEFLVPKMQIYFRLPKITLRQTNFKMADDVQQKQLALQLNQMGKLSDTTLLGESGWEFEKELYLRNRENHMLMDEQRKTMIQQAEAAGMAQVTQMKYAAIGQVEAMRAQNMMQNEDIAKAQMAGIMPPGAEAVPQGGMGGAPGQPGAGGAPVQMAQGGVVTGPQGGGGGKSAPQGKNGQGAQKDSSMASMVKTWAQGLMSLPPEHRERTLASYEEKYPEMAKQIRSYMKELQKQTIDMRPLPEQKPPRRKSSPV